MLAQTLRTSSRSPAGVPSIWSLRAIHRLLYGRRTSGQEPPTVKDGDLIQVAQDLSVYDKSEKKRLGEALDLRNDCGHPVRYKPGEKRVSSFIEDLTSIVFT